VETFQITMKTTGVRHELALGGEIDLDVAPSIVELGTVSLRDPMTQMLIIELREVTFIDATGIGALIELHHIAQHQHKHLRIAHTPVQAQRVLRLSGLDRIFDQV
jgi:anti-anti-sigma factor